LTEAVTTEEEAAARRQRRLRRRAWLWVALVVVAAWVAACALLLVQARRDIVDGLASVRAAEKLTSPDDLVEGRPLASLAEARSAFRSARDRLHHPALTPVRWLPVAGRQLRTATALASAASTVTDVSADSVRQARAALEAVHGTGPERIALLRRLADVADRAEERLGRLDLGPSRALVDPLHERRAELVERLDEVREGLRDGALVANGLADLLDGPRRYLVLAANNGEMRAGSGMFLSVGELRFEHGDLSLGEFRATGDLTLAPPAAPPIEDADLAGRWGWLNPNQEWRNLGASPRFDATAALVARMWAATGGGAVDGVLALDPFALQGVLQGTGPVTVGERTVTTDTVVAQLLHDQYGELPPPGPRFDLAQAGRREQLGLIAKASLDAVTGGRFETAELADGLAAAARGRHILAWSSLPREQEMWERAELAGTLAKDSLLMAVLNRGGNKLDQFLHVRARLAFRPTGSATDAELRVTLENRTPEGEVAYVAGPYPGSGVGGGDYTGLLAVDFPAFAGEITSDGGEPAAAGADGPARVLAVPVRVDRGQSREVVFRFRVEARHGALTVEPDGRAPAVEWTVPGGAWATGERRRVEW
jgi:hypothetical protein